MAAAQLHRGCGKTFLADRLKFVGGAARNKGRIWGERILCNWQDSLELSLVFSCSDAFRLVVCKG